MKLKPIEPGMKIHCKNDNELSALLKECEIKGYVWYGTGNKPTKPVLPIDNIICLYDDKYGLNITYTSNSSKINTEFSDLIIPELTAEEVFDIMAEMHTECHGKVDGCLGCPIITVAEHCDADCFGRNAKAIIEICEQWKADHEKKEPEVEWGDICRIIEVQNNGVKKCVYEEDLVSNLDAGEKESVVEGILKQYATENKGEYIAVVEHICRVKAVE